MTPRGLSIVLATGALYAFALWGGPASELVPAAAGPAAAATPVGDTGSGAIAGKVSFSGSPPPPQRVKLSADPKCAAFHKGGLERIPVRVEGGGVADVLVYVKSGIGGWHAPSEPVLLDQLGCEYSPRLIAMMVGQPLRIRNSDDTLHNIHPRPTLNREFNIGQPRKGMESTKTFETPELMIPIGCDVHPWMRAHISVLAHPFFAVTKADGSYEIKSLPDGEYEVEAVHSQLKSVTSKAIVKGSQATTLDFSFRG